MSARPENEFPTIEDARDVLQSLIDKGFGKLPITRTAVYAIRSGKNWGWL